MRQINTYIIEKLHLNKDIDNNIWDDIIEFFIKVIAEIGGHMKGYWFNSYASAAYEFDMLNDGSTKDYCDMLENDDDFLSFLKDENIDNLTKQQIDFLRDYDKTDEARNAMRKAYIKKCVDEREEPNEKEAEIWLDKELKYANET